MATVIPASLVSIAELETRLGLGEASQPDFFSEWQAPFTDLTTTEKSDLDRVKAHFKRLLKRPPLLENSVKMVVLSPLLDLAGFYDEPFRMRSEASVEIAIADQDTIIRGKIDVLVLQDDLWILVIEAKRSDFDVTVAIAQALAYLMSYPQPDRPTFALITNGQNFLFLKLIRQPQPLYANSQIFSLLNPGNDLYRVLQIMRRLGRTVTATD